MLVAGSEIEIKNFTDPGLTISRVSKTGRFKEKRTMSDVVGIGSITIFRPSKR